MNLPLTTTDSPFVCVLYMVMAKWERA